jgi:N-acetylmuramic acid 6-phosphate etherase
MNIDLSHLTTESVNPATRMLDCLSTLDMVTLINEEDQKVALAVKTQLPAIAQAIDAIVAAMEQGGRLIYMGAGTSGRLGILDASECPPTYGVSDQQVMGLIAGGEKAVFKAQENVEDSTTLGVEDLKRVNATGRDVICAIAASGRTPYCIAALNYANDLGCTTLAVTCNPGAPMTNLAKIAIVPEVGPEVVSGSTRMKAGTAQKLVLNMLSTGSMVKLGKVYGNLMVDVMATNAKLHVRCENIVMEATGIGREEAQAVLMQADGKVKLAICMALTGLKRDEAEKKLSAAQGKLRSVLTLEGK